MRICLSEVSFFQNASGPRAADLTIPLTKCPLVGLLGPGFDVFFDCSTIDTPFLDIKTLCESSLEEILRGLLLRHRRQQMKQYRRSEQREHKGKIVNGRETQKESVQVS